MQIEYTGRNFHLDENLRSYIEQKLKKVVRLLDEPIDVHVILELEKHRHIAELHITHRHGVIQAKEETDGTAEDVINVVVVKAEEQARRAKDMLVDRRRRNGHRWPVEVLDHESVGGGGAPRIIQRTDLEIKPMTIEEAALELENSENHFVVFRDSSSDRLSVLYRRKDKNYGLIAPSER
jgi:putative sigma-54 modulation protein